MSSEEEAMLEAFEMFSTIDEFRPDSEVLDNDLEIYEDTMEGTIAFCSTKDFEKYFKHCNEESALKYFAVVGGGLE